MYVGQSSAFYHSLLNLHLQFRGYGRREGSICSERARLRLRLRSRSQDKALICSKDKRIDQQPVGLCRQQAANGRTTGMLPYEVTSRVS
jgi:hypothetical protein